MNKHIKLESTHPNEHHYFGGPPTPPRSSKSVIFNPHDNSSTIITNDNNLPSTSSPSKADTLDDELSTEKMDQIFERKRKRRESHNVVERRRRDNINARIDELSTLLPNEMITQKLNRGIILENSVKHIRLLHQQINDQQQRIKELEVLLGMRSQVLGQQQQQQQNNQYNDHHLHHQQYQQQLPPSLGHNNSNENMINGNHDHHYSHQLPNSDINESSSNA
ncbi:hypothetical protein BJ944DRAFT_259487 [Cunninghamella echinulata]|nr:hypothetical protein BJ944DRAFT_259487 [Cunninghamella echinulata]